MKQTAFAYVLSFIVLTPALLLTTAFQMPSAIIPIAFVAIALSFVAKQPLSRLWSDRKVRASLVQLAICALILFAVLEFLRPTDEPFMAFVLFVVLPALVVFVVVVNRLQKHAWRGSPGR